MITLLLVITMVLMVVFLIGAIYAYHDEPFCCLAIVAALLSLFLFVWDVALCIELMDGRTLDQRIALYQEENQAIEDQINELVLKYQAYESDTFEKFQKEDAITMVSLFPELKSDALVQRQLEIYQENHQKLKELKEERINLSNVKWQLYFGE